MKRSYVVGAVSLLVALSGGCGGGASNVAGPSRGQTFGRPIVSPSIFIFPASEPGDEIELSGEVTNSVDPTTTVQVVERDGEMYAKYGYKIAQLVFIHPTWGRTAASLSGMEAAGLISDSTTVYVPDDSVTYAYDPIQLNGASPSSAAAALGNAPPPPPPPIIIPPPPADTTSSGQEIKRVSWGTLKRRWR